MPKEKFLFRSIFSKKLVIEMAGRIHTVWPSFDEKGFAQGILLKLDDLSFGDRSQLITDYLAKYLPKEYKQTANILLNSLGPEPTNDSLTGIEGFYIMPMSKYVSTFGLENYDISMNLLYEMTKRFTVENEMRYFYFKEPEKTLEFLHNVTKDPSPFARRIASEGMRPRLPLSPRIKEFQENPKIVINILKKLKQDSNLMVRRSVANNLNDISKDNPDIVVETLKNWKKLKDPETDWLIKHALRTLLKQGHPGALELLGYPTNVNLSVTNLKISNTQIEPGDYLTFGFNIKSEEKQDTRLMVDYVIHFMKANSKIKPKVFKLTKKTIITGETLNISKRHPFKKLINTKFYSGQHKLEIQINGKRVGEVGFVLRGY